MPPMCTIVTQRQDHNLINIFSNFYLKCWFARYTGVSPYLLLFYGEMKRNVMLCLHMFLHDYSSYYLVMIIVSCAIILARINCKRLTIWYSLSNDRVKNRTLLIIKPNFLLRSTSSATDSMICKALFITKPKYRSKSPLSSDNVVP